MNGLAAWSLLVGAGLLEIVWASALKRSAGMSLFWPSALAVVTAALSFALLAVALRHIPVGTGYAAWVGIGAAGVMVAGFVLFGETLSIAKVACLCLIICGVAGLKIFGGAG